MEKETSPYQKAQLGYDELEIHSELRWLARELCLYFPQLDLRFNIQEGRPTLHCSVPLEAGFNQKHSEEISASEDVKTLELNAYELSAEELLVEAIFNIKEVAQLFDD